MLAERKRKIMWSSNPNGCDWVKDNSKFGQKILEKFGWTPGKGLGVDEQGITAPIRLKCNSTQKGLGYERRLGDDLFQHQVGFSSILSVLNSSEAMLSDSDSTTLEKCTSLEQKSKNCKTRVHYHKFTRGKDLSRYSEKDLSCILGAIPSLTSKNDDNTDEKSIEIINHTTTTEHFSNNSNGNSEVKRKKKKKNRQNKMDDVITDNVSSNNQMNQNNQNFETNKSKIKNGKKKRKNAAAEENTFNEPSYGYHELNSSNCELETETISESNDTPVRKKKRRNKLKM